MGNKRNRMVVAVNPDGSVAGYFESITQAVNKYGADRVGIYRSCVKGTTCHGMKFFYEKDFRQIYMRCEYEKLRFTLDPNRDPKTSKFVKGHKMGDWRKRKPESEKRRLEKYKATIRKQMEAGTYFRPGRSKRPVVCLEDNREFPSVMAAAEFYGVSPSIVSTSARFVRTTRMGLRFRYKSTLERIKEVI